MINPVLAGTLRDQVEPRCSPVRRTAPVGTVLIAHSRGRDLSHRVRAMLSRRWAHA